MPDRVLRERPVVLLVGGLDSSGGAGVLRDAQAVARFGGEARVALTAVTAQTDRAVLDVHPVPLATVRAQVDAALRQGPVMAVKIGMLGTAATVRAVADALPRDVPWVVDPVLASSSGAPLLDEDGVAVLLDTLLPRARLATPNLPELAALAARCGIGAAEAQAQAGIEALLARVPAVLAKGGHAHGVLAVDRLHQRGLPPREFAAPRHPFALRGTGCLLASLVATALACGDPLETAAARARAALAEWFAAHARERR
ncbi:bifunctional hydroxymethylpyrimidine kinase/phosphomethylpyrimidine kinase [[Pseudomonas] boreopolis]|uniref:bifunctional hydroxymethylpyrimidine kinase/phosphomethylpyrimidine kinase n=1 Tax=Xanthomonas boreopolis TaxID=86183 RepID=UPI003D9BA0E8